MVICDRLWSHKCMGITVGGGYPPQAPPQMLQQYGGGTLPQHQNRSCYCILGGGTRKVNPNAYLVPTAARYICNWIRFSWAHIWDWFSYRHLSQDNAPKACPITNQRKEHGPKGSLVRNQRISDFLWITYETKTLQKHPWSEIKERLIF